MGYTLAKDFCFHCHSEITQERKTHQGIKFQDCTTSGCHNFHDNTMLYEKFLIKHIREPALSATPSFTRKNGTKTLDEKKQDQNSGRGC